MNKRKLRLMYGIIFGIIFGIILVGTFSYLIFSEKIDIKSLSKSSLGNIVSASSYNSTDDEGAFSGVDEIDPVWYGVSDDPLKGMPLNSYSRFTDTIQNEKINITYTDIGLNFKTGEINKTISYKDALIPEELQGRLKKWKVKNKSTNGELTEVQIQYEFDTNENLLSGEKFDSKISFNSSGEIDEFKTKGGKIEVEAISKGQALTLKYYIENNTYSKKFIDNATLENLFIFDVQEINRTLYENNESGLYYNIDLNITRTKLGDILKDKNVSEIQNYLNKYYNYQGGNISYEQAIELKQDLINPPVVATKGRLVSYDLGDFDLINNKDEIVNVKINFDTEGDWKNLGVRLKFGSGSTDINAVAFSQDNNWLAFGGDENKVFIYNVTDWSNVANITGSDNFIYTLAFSPDNNWLAYAGYTTGDIFVHNVPDWSFEIELTAPGDDTFSLAFSQDSKWLASVGYDNSVRIYRVSDWSDNATLVAGSGDERSLAFSQDNNWLAAGSDDTNVYVYSVSDWSLETTLTEAADDIDSLAFSQDNKWIAYAQGGSPGSVFVHDVGGIWGLETTLTSIPSYPGSVAFSQDSKWLAYGATGWDYIYVYDVSDWSNVVNLTESSDSIKSISFSQDNNWIAYGTDDTNVYVHNMIVEVVDTCTYTSGNWNVDCSDNCVINSPVDLNGNDISILGTGTFTMTADIYNYGLAIIKGTDSSNKCIVTCDGGCLND